MGFVSNYSFTKLIKPNYIISKLILFIGLVILIGAYRNVTKNILERLI